MHFIWYFAVSSLFSGAFTKLQIKIKNTIKQIIFTQDLCFCILKFLDSFHSSVGQPKGNLFPLQQWDPYEMFCSQCPTLVVGFLLSAVLHFLSLMNMLSLCSPQSNLSWHTLSLCPSWVQKVKRLIPAVLLLINSYMWSILKWNFEWQVYSLHPCFQLAFTLTWCITSALCGRASRTFCIKLSSGLQQSLHSVTQDSSFWNSKGTK